MFSRKNKPFKTALSQGPKWLSEIPQPPTFHQIPQAKKQQLRDITAPDNADAVREDCCFWDLGDLSSWRIHGIGIYIYMYIIYTYMNGQFLWFSCR